MSPVKDHLRNRWVLFGAVGAAAVAIAVVLISVSVVGSSDSKTAATTSAPTPTATVEHNSGGTAVPRPAKVAGAAETIALFNGIPQQLNVLGKATAPVEINSCAQGIPSAWNALGIGASMSILS